MQDFLNISELELIRYAMHGLCDFILKAPSEDLCKLNSQYTEMHSRRAHVDDQYKQVRLAFQQVKERREGA